MSMKILVMLCRAKEHKTKIEFINMRSSTKGPNEIYLNNKNRNVMKLFINCFNQAFPICRGVQFILENLVVWMDKRFFKIFSRM